MRGILDSGRRMSAKYILSHFLFPILDDEAARQRVGVEEQLASMICARTSIRSRLDDPRVAEKMSATFSHPGIQFLLGRFSGYLMLSREEVLDALPWWLDRIEETRPSFHRVIIEEPGGREWFGDTLHEILSIFGEYTGKRTCQ